jgi:D-alanyl-D-alanine carboxypeptidase
MTTPRFVLLPLLFLLAVSAAAQSKKKQIAAYLQKMHRDSLFNGNALVVDNGKVVLKTAIGWADASREKKLTMDHRFHIGSIAKEFDAVAIMMLAEQGKLSLDDKLSRFFTDLPAWASQVSVRNILQYTSGLPDINYREVRNDADNWNALLKITTLNFSPGSQYAYNNNNTFLRRRLVEKLTGMPFNEYVLRVMLPKAGVKNGVMDPTERDAPIAISFNGAFQQEKLAVPVSGWTCLTAGGLYRWSEAINTFKLIGPASTEIILTPVEPGKQAGLGRGILKNGQVAEHFHDGVALRYQAVLVYDAAKKRTIILLTSQRRDNVSELAEHINGLLDRD